MDNTTKKDYINTRTNVYATVKYVDEKLPTIISEEVLFTLSQADLQAALDSCNLEEGNCYITVDKFPIEDGKNFYMTLNGKEYQPSYIYTTEPYTELYFNYSTDDSEDKTLISFYGNYANDNWDEDINKILIEICYDIDINTDLSIITREVKALDNKMLDRDLKIENSLSMNRNGSIGEYSTALGYGCQASGYASHAEGDLTIASGIRSHAEGCKSIASGTYSHAEGLHTIAKNYSSHAEGDNTIAGGQDQHVQGRYNIEDTTNTYAHIVGNGKWNVNTNQHDRSNAHTLDWDGNGWFAGKVTAGTDPTDDMDLTTKKYVDEKTPGVVSQETVITITKDELIAGIDDIGDIYATVPSITVSDSDVYTMSIFGRSFSFKLEPLWNTTDPRWARINITDDNKDIMCSIELQNYCNKEWEEDFDQLLFWCIFSNEYLQQKEELLTDVVITKTSTNVLDAAALPMDLKVYNSIKVGEMVEEDIDISYSISVGDNCSASHSNAAFGMESHAKGVASISAGSSNVAIGTADAVFGMHNQSNGSRYGLKPEFVIGTYSKQGTEGQYIFRAGNGTPDKKKSNAHTLDWDGNAWYAGEVQATNTGYLIEEETIVHITKEELEAKWNTTQDYTDSSIYLTIPMFDLDDDNHLHYVSYLNGVETLSENIYYNTYDGRWNIECYNSTQELGVYLGAYYDAEWNDSETTAIVKIDRVDKTQAPVFTSDFKLIKRVYHTIDNNHLDSDIIIKNTIAFDGAIASNRKSVSLGSNTIASGYASHAEGSNGVASGGCSHVEGTNTKASGYASHVEGSSSSASGEASHAEGNTTQAIGSASHAEGWYTIANTAYSHAEGFYAEARGEGSHAEGGKTIASGKYQHAQGRYNIEDTENKYAHIVGNGKNDSSTGWKDVRSNAHTLDWDGNAWYAGQVMANNLPWSTLEIGDLIIEQTIQMEPQPNGTGMGYTSNIPITFAEGEKICVTFNGEQYICETRKIDNYNIHAGNGILNGEDEIHNNEPFAVTFSRYGNECIVRFCCTEENASSEIPVKIEKATGELHKLDEMYLPNSVATKKYVDDAVVANNSTVDEDELDSILTDIFGMTNDN